MNQHHSELTDAARKTFLEKNPQTLSDADWESAIQWQMKEIAAKKRGTTASEKAAQNLASFNIQNPHPKK